MIGICKRMLERNSEHGARLLIRARESHDARDAAALKKWAGQDSGRTRLVTQMDAALEQCEGLKFQPMVRAWLDEARAQGVEERSAASRPDFRRPMALAASFAAAIMVFTLVAAHFHSRKPDGQEIASAVGEQKRIRLADGSNILLDSATTVRVAYSDEERDIELVRGQAKFDVAHDARRPFHVRMGERDVVAVGTSFNILREGSTLQVSLLEGKVLISRLEQQDSLRRYLGSEDRVPLLTLSPGQQYEERRGAEPSLRAFDKFTVSSWEQGMIVFDNALLSDAAATVNRHSPKKLIVKEPLGSRRISGVYRAGNALVFANAVASLYPEAQVREDAADIVLQD